MKRLLIIIFVTVIHCLTLQSPVRCQEQDHQSLQVVEVWGESPVYDGNRAEAKDRALQEAFSAAITKVMGAYITAESFSQNFVSIDRTVLTRSEGYVKTYDILEVREEPDYLSVHIRASVSTERIKDDLTALGILLDAMDNPVFSVYGRDQGLKESRSVSTFRTALSEKGFQITDGGQADVLIELSGTISSQNIAAGSELYGAIVSLKAAVKLRSTGALIVEESSRANGAGLTLDGALTEAYTEAASHLVGDVVDAIATKWARQVTSGREIQLTLTSGDYRKAQLFQRNLARLFGVKKVDLKSYNNGRVRYSVRFKGNARTLVDLILQRPPKGMRVVLENLDANAISMRLQ